MTLIFKITTKNPCDDGGYHYVQTNTDTFDREKFEEFSGVKLKPEIVASIQKRIDNLPDGKYLEINFRED